MDERKRKKRTKTENGDERNRETVSTDGSAAGERSGRTKGNEAENQVSRTGRNRRETGWDRRGNGSDERSKRALTELARGKVRKKRKGKARMLSSRRSEAGADERKRSGEIRMPEERERKEPG